MRDGESLNQKKPWPLSSALRPFCSAKLAVVGRYLQLKKTLKTPCTTEQLLHVLRSIKFADIEEQGFIPVYERQRVTDELHDACSFRTDYQFITKRKMKEIQKKSKRR